MKFDWIDFGLSWQESWEPGAHDFDKLLHTSTACLLAHFLRRRDAPFRKVFCWLRQEEGVLETSAPDLTGVRLVEATFPFARYSNPGSDRLDIFAQWLVQTVAQGAPELNIDDREKSELLRRLSAEQYTYIRVEKLKRAPDEPKCEVRYRHTPVDVMVTAICRLDDGQTLCRSLRDERFLRDELYYARTITKCSIVADQLVLESDFGTL